MPIAIRTEAELLAAVPYLLGFAPRASLVVLGLEQGTISHTLRVNLPDEVARRRAWLGATTELCVRHQGHGLCLIGFDGEEQCSPLLGVLADRLRRRGVPVDALLLAGASRWWHLDADTCTDCPGDGHEIGEQMGLEVAAEFVVRGRTPFAGRSALADSLAPDLAYLELVAGARFVAAPVADLASACGADPRDGTRPLADVRAVEAWQALLTLTPWWDPPPEELGGLAASVADADWRDALLASLVPGLLPDNRLDPALARQAGQLCGAARDPIARSAAIAGDVHRVVLDRVRLLARRTPGPLAAGPYAMLAVLSGCWGDSVMAVLAAERACRAQPDHVLATLVLQLYACGGSLPGPARMIRCDVG